MPSSNKALNFLISSAEDNTVLSLLLELVLVFGPVLQLIRCIYPLNLYQS